MFLIFSKEKLTKFHEQKEQGIKNIKKKNNRKLK